MRQRIRATRSAAISPPVQIGIRLTRTGRIPAAAAAATGGGSAEISGPYVVEIGAYAGNACTWIVWMRGAATADWALTWDDMALNPDYVTFDPSFDATDTVQLIITSNNVTNLVAYATVAGTVYASSPVTCAI
jgi:hypothetical protein